MFSILNHILLNKSGQLVTYTYTPREMRNPWLWTLYVSTRKCVSFTCDVCVCVCVCGVCCCVYWFS